MNGFEVESIAPMTMTRHNRLANMYVLSPYVWRDDAGFHLLIRAVPRRDDEPRLKMAEIWYGTSGDGRHFDMAEAPVIFPGPDLADLDGCEDPTVDVRDGLVRVWYTGFNQKQETGRLMLARGPGVARLAKAGVMIDSRPPRYANPKEATLVTLGKDRWRLYFEYARDGASLIGQSDSGDLDGDWEDAADAPLAPRPDRWDCWHLSAGPVVGDGGDRPVMFYNGATQDAQWRVGWAAFDRHYTKVIARSDDPLIVPDTVGDGATDIAFAASAVETDEGILLYFSQSDQDLRCALIRRT
ncbi:hypothetical protein [Sphingomonas sp.]|uniref:glycoside hydrolase family 130 protein n=1 Tax=Sphingomonas sp. TaxID=28214 RepID=UPI003CC5AF46